MIFDDFKHLKKKSKLQLQYKKQMLKIKKQRIYAQSTKSLNQKKKST